MKSPDESRDFFVLQRLIDDLLKVHLLVQKTNRNHFFK